MKKQLKRIMMCMMVIFGLQLAICTEVKPNQMPQQAKNVVEFLKKNKKEYSTLEQALEAAGLTNTLEGEGPFTIFVPTNRAFEQLPKGTLEKLLDPKNKAQLTDILTYHVIKGKLPSEELSKLNGQEITMLNGKKAKVEVKDGAVYIDGARVLKADIPVGNGMIHVVDTVLLP